MENPRSAKILLELLRKNAKGDANSKEKLITKYRGFIQRKARELKRRYKSGLCDDDLFQDGVVGLLMAARDSSFWINFTKNAEKKICEYLGLAIRQEKYFRDGQGVLVAEFVAYRRERAKLFIKLGRNPTLAEMAMATGLGKQKLERLEKFYNVAVGYDE